MRAVVLGLLCLAPFEIRAGAYAMKLSITANGPWVKVGDILEPAPPKKLADMKIKRLEGPGKSVQITRDLVLMKVREARLGGPNAISGTVTVVLGSSRTVKGEDIRAFAEKYLRERLAPLSSAAEVEVQPRELPGDFLVPDRPVRLELPAPPQGRFKGNVVLRIIAHQTAEDGSDLVVGQSIMTCLVKVKQRLLVTLKPIRRGEFVTAANATVDLVDATYNLEDGYTGFDEVSGLKVKAYIGAGKLVSPTMLERPPLIRRGDIVKLVVRSGLVSVAVSGKAMRDAAAGDSIPIEVSDSKKQVQGRVLDEHTVISDSR